MYSILLDSDLILGRLAFSRHNQYIIHVLLIALIGISFDKRGVIAKLVLSMTYNWQQRFEGNWHEHCKKVYAKLTKYFFVYQSVFG